MSEIKPNHICKNVNCNKGADGGKKHYYACDYCDRTFNWKSVACSKECYQEYMKQVIDARALNKRVNNLPERTDKTENEVQEILAAPVEEVLSKTKEDLKDYIANEDSDITEIVEDINQNFDKTKVRNSQRKKVTNSNDD